MTEARKDLVHPGMKKLQEDIAALQKSVGDRFDGADVQFRRQSRDSAGMPVLLRGATGTFDERVAALENRICVLESRPG